MPEFLNRVSGQLTEFWNKFTTKQKIQILSIAIVAIVALGTLIFILNRPDYVLLKSDLKADEINSITDALDDAGISSKVGDDTQSVYVERSQQQTAILTLAEDGIVSSSEINLSNLFDTSLMTTESEWNVRYQEYLEGELADSIELLDEVDSAEVDLVMPDSDTTILDDAKEARASILVTPKDQLSDSTVQSIAKLVVNAVDNLDLTNVSIIDSYGRLLFDGENQDDNMGNISSQTDYEMQKELMVKNNVRSILLSAGEYDDATVSVDLVIDFDQLQSVTETHTTPDGSNEGVITNETTHSEESTNASSSGGEPGTDSNAVTDTLTSDGSNSTVTIEERDVTYTYNQEVSTAVKAIGGVEYDQSTVTVSLTKYHTYNQTMLEADGTLGDMSWEQYKYNIMQQGRVKIDDIDQDIIDMVQMASNIDNVKVVAYEVPKFVDEETSSPNIKDYVLIGVIVLMILLLGYAVYKGTEPVEVKEIEPELSVEEMLTTTRESQELENIEFDSKSEARVQIENFVDQNPDAVAMLLRNWLNEDWE